MFSNFKVKSLSAPCEANGAGDTAHYRRPMMRGLLLGLMLTFVNATGAAESVRPFTPGSLERVLGAREGKPFILVLWSLECQYCPTELKMLSEFKRTHPKLDVVLIATDPISDAPQLISRTESYGMGKIEQWAFAQDIPERLRFEIDRRWYGEVPRTYFYDQKHQREAKTGLISKQFVEDWLVRNVAPDSGPP